ncbi:Putative CRISPR type III-B/RAMP module RAMP protein Cmr4 [Desulfonema limicola]|uniref:CRISPR type III-B/RAMP module RAMP protein Cmr4 n=1 Tax=Desulfonema limicola TaxID=45656 RepID=A0A975GGH5_9BACT|nr:type III-B CRISPR module RAMP protein Cmr4 [Desulfonema limicola]QTA80249.1 Putative CRISPR type III-B/RAMP module RAMP protein Cmr4 [Desulfonema limicola]
MINKIFTIHTLSPVHCGIGQGLNDIDLPTARNSISGHPIIPASSIKGVLKEAFLNKETGCQNEIESLFGSDSGDFASAVSIGDANLLALPVRSFYGTFAYLVSPYTLMQLKTLFKRIGSTDILPAIPEVGLEENNYKVFLTENSLLKGNNNLVLFEEMDLLAVQNNRLADEWADIIASLYFNDDEGKEIFKKRFAIIDDNALNFCCESGLPVDARIAIDVETGTVKDGALWYEETIPPETLFVGIIGIDRSYNKNNKATDIELKDFLTKSDEIYFQVGGKYTTGKGFVSLKFNERT